MLSKQSQKGGDSSTNIQAEQLVINMGIDEKRAREIYQEMNLQLKKEYTKEALDIANLRVEEFENSLMHKMNSVEGAMQAFSDPSFQLLLVDAQKAAAATERSADYDLLSELLVHRFRKGDNRTVRAGITRAVEIVDEISDEALLGLTVAHSVMLFFPNTGDIDTGLDMLDGLFGKIFYNKLPNGDEWLDHLDVLNAVRLNSFGGMKKINQYYPEMCSGYIDVGIRKYSESYTQAIEILSANNLPHNLLIEHSLRDEFVRLPIRHRRQIKEMFVTQEVTYNGITHNVPFTISSLQVKALENVYDLYLNDAQLKSQNINVFMNLWERRENLKLLRSWWDNINTSFQLTSVGKVLAHANAQRCENQLPPLN